MVLNRNTGLYGVVGLPLGRSLSPVMHNAAFKAKNLNAVYLAFETGDIRGCLRGMRALGIRGMSVTIPHKSAVIPLLDEVDDLAKRIGAVNTIVNDNGRLTGYNTDALGAIKALEDKIQPAGTDCLLIGAGGAARAIGFMLKQRGARLTVANRTTKRGEELARLLRCPFAALSEVAGLKADLLIQATPAGMYPMTGRSVVSPEILRKGMVVMDIVYNPVETRLLRDARERGCHTINGVAMFLNQGAEQFRLWTGMDAPLASMAGAVDGALGGLE